MASRRKSKNLDVVVGSTSSTPRAMAQSRKGSKKPLHPSCHSSDESSTQYSNSPLVWTKSDDIQLFQRIRKQVPKNDVISYAARTSQLNWSSIAFEDYTAAHCKNRWIHVEGRLRHHRLIAELLDDAEKLDRPWYECMKGGKKAVLPKQPTPFNLFSDESMAKFLNDGHSLTGARDKCRDAYKAMKDKQKLQWIYRAQEQEPEFNEEIEKFKRQHPDIEVPAKKLSLLTKDELQIKHKYEGIPVKPPNSGYSLFSKKLLSGNSLKQFGPKERMTEISRLWKELSDEEKTKYNDKATQMKHAYKMKYASYLETLTPDQQNEV